MMSVDRRDFVSPERDQPKMYYGLNPLCLHLPGQVAFQRVEGWVAHSLIFHDNSTVNKCDILLYTSPSLCSIISIVI